MADEKKVVIMGAAGRDLHDFNTFFRNNEDYEVVAFTAAQIPDIAGRKYPAALAGDLYPEGIPIRPQEELEEIIEEKDVDQVVLSFSDLSHDYVMHQASRAIAAGADFRLMGTKHSMLESDKPVISVGAVRTGCGKSQTTRKLASILNEQGYKVAVIRHPMPYGNLEEQAVQRFANYEDLEENKCTIEEREEYEQHIEEGNIVFAGVDYEKILRRAEEEANIILWDGGNNEPPFYKPDLHFVLTDPLRAGAEVSYHPGEANLRLADYVIINKENSAEEEEIQTVERNVNEVNSQAEIIHADSVVSVKDKDKIKGKRVLVVEDGPTLTHGGMDFGAGTVAAKKYGAKEIVDPRHKAVGSIKDTYEKFDQLGKVLPAMGYGKEQREELEETINAVDCDLVVIGTPMDLRKVININKEAVRVKYDLKEKNKSLQEITADNKHRIGL